LSLGITSITPEVARELASAKEYHTLYLNNLSSLTPETAKELIKFQ
jgi:hypothetical protein